MNLLALAAVAVVFQRPLSVRLTCEKETSTRCYYKPDDCGSRKVKCVTQTIAHTWQIMLGSETAKDIVISLG